MSNGSQVMEQYGGSKKEKEARESVWCKRPQAPPDIEAGNEEGAVCLSLVAQWLFGTLLYIKAAACLLIPAVYLHSVVPYCM